MHSQNLQYSLTNIVTLLIHFLFHIFFPFHSTKGTWWFDLQKKKQNKTQTNKQTTKQTNTNKQKCPKNVSKLPTIQESYLGMYYLSYIRALATINLH